MADTPHLKALDLRPTKNPNSPCTRFHSHCTSVHGTLDGVNVRDQLAQEAATLYYLQDEKMESIASKLGVSRSTVSRLLSHARQVGLVRISVSSPPGSSDTLAQQFSERFGINTRVVPVGSADTDLNRLQNVGAVAAEYLVNMLFPGATLGIAWGNTTSMITNHLPPVDLPGMIVVQLNGASNAADSGMPYAQAIITQAASALGATMMNFPVPAFFDYASTKEAMWRERSVRQVLRSIESCDVALFGVGAMEGPIPSHVYSGGFLDQRDLDEARQDGVVGDVCTVLLREDGSTDMELNSRASGPFPSQLKRIPRRLCVAAGDSKALPLVAALNSGVVTDLVIDSSLARVALNRMQAGRRPVGAS